MGDINASISNRQKINAGIKETLLRGASAYEMAVLDGYVGTEEEWLASLHGTDGHTPELSSERTGSKETTLYADGVAFARILDGIDGADGRDGQNGQDGHSPEITATKSGKTVSIKVDGTEVATVSDGNDGSPGATGPSGADGHTPVITATKSGKVTTIKADGTTIAEIDDGNDGATGATGPTGPTGPSGPSGSDGADGFSPTATVTKSGSIATITITDKNGTTTAEVHDGQGGTVTIDSTPTEGSTNAVSSGGVYDELTDLKSDLNDLETDIEEVYTGIPVVVIDTVNKLNLQTNTLHTSIGRNGVLNEYDNTQTTDYIPIVAGKSSVAFTTRNSNGTARLCRTVFRIVYFDSSKSVLGYEELSNNQVGTLPTGTAYIRLSAVNTYMEDFSPMVEFVDSASEISPTYVEYSEVSEYSHGINYLDETQKSILTRLGTVESEVDSYAELPELIAENTDRISDLAGDPAVVSKLGEFVHGYIKSTDGTINTNYNYRIATPDMITTDADYTMTVADGFRVYLYIFDEQGVKVSAYWYTGNIEIRKGTIFRMTVARVTENTQENVDIEEFCSKVTIVSKDGFGYIAETVHNIDAVIPYGVTWDWWISANSIDKFGNVYIGYIDTDSYAGVIRRQPDGVMQYKRLEGSWNDDDHNGMATIVLDDGRILVIGSHGHAQDNHIICYRSVEPYSINEMEKLSFDIPQTGQYKYNTTYSQIFKYNGKLFDFMRVSVQQSGSTITNGTGYLCLISADNGDTWTAYKAIQSSDPYVAFVSASDDSKIVKGVYTNNPGTRPVNMMKGFTFNMDTYEFADLSGTKIGELVLLDNGEIADTNIAHYADMTDLVQRGETNQSCRLFYVCKTPKASTSFLYAIAGDSTNADWTYKLYKAGTVIDVGHSGVPFGSNTYISGACFGKDVDTVYYAKATTSLADGNHELHKVKISGTTVESDEIIAESAVGILRPLFLGNGEVATVVGCYNDQKSDGTYNGRYTEWTLKPMFTHG